MAETMRVLLTGATGFVGSHVYPVLAANGFEVVSATRHPVEASAKHRNREFRALDVHDGESARRAMEGLDAAVYLVHGMREGGAYLEEEQQAAHAFAKAAADAGLKRIVYLGGMRPNGKVSKHLQSRLLTGEILRAGSVPTVELQATMVVGGGSESFRILRDLAARLPVMLLPRWLDHLSEPIAVKDVAHAIAFALRMPLTDSVALTLPGPERLSGREMILRTAHLLHHKPRTLRVPFISPHLSSYWIRLVTRADPHIAAELVEGLLSDIVSEGSSLWSLMPEYRRMGFDDAAKIALAEEESELSVGSRMLETALKPLARRSIDGEVPR